MRLFFEFLRAVGWAEIQDLFDYNASKMLTISSSK